MQVDRELESKLVKIRDDPNLFSLKQQPNPASAPNASKQSIISPQSNISFFESRVTFYIKMRQYRNLW